MKHDWEGLAIIVVFSAVFFLLGVTLGVGVEGATQERHYSKIVNSLTEKLSEVTAERDMALLMSRGKLESFSALVSWYGPGFHGRSTASGDIFDENTLTVAHRELPFGTVLFLENHKNGKSTVARVTDRGPYVAPRTLDVSRKVAEHLGIIEEGVAVIRCRVISIGKVSGGER